jgi:hypothetical protein
VPADLNDLGDVNAAAPSDGEALTWDTGTSQWVPAAPGGGSGHTIKDEGSARPARANLNFIGDAVSAVDDAASDETEVRVSTYAPKLGGVMLFPVSSGYISVFGVYQRMYLAPFTGSGNSYASIRAYVETSGASGVIRFGVYSVDGYGILDRDVEFGTVAATSTGLKTLTISPAWTPNYGQTYYLAVVIQGTSTVRVSGTNSSAGAQSVNVQAATLFPNFLACYQDSVSGALPATSNSYYNGVTTGAFPAILLGSM